MTKFRKRFDPLGKDYDYEIAIKEGVRPVKVSDDNRPHWGSRAPKSGQSLKGRGHPTWFKHEVSEELGGYDLKYDTLKGKYFSFPKGNRKPPKR